MHQLLKDLSKIIHMMTLASWVFRLHHPPHHVSKHIPVPILVVFSLVFLHVGQVNSLSSTRAIPSKMPRLATFEVLNTLATITLRGPVAPTTDWSLTPCYLPQCRSFSFGPLERPPYRHVHVLLLRLLLPTFENFGSEDR